jgi:hypothetical protein
VLEQQPHHRVVAAAQPGAKHQVTVVLLELLAHDTGVAGLQARPVHMPGDARRQHRAQLGRGMPGVAENALEQRVVKGSGGRLKCIRHNGVGCLIAV